MSKTINRVRFFDTARTAQRAINTEICVAYHGQGLKYDITEATADVLPADVCPDTHKWVVQLIDRASGEPKGVVTETVKRGVSFTKPKTDQFRETSEQTILADGEPVGSIECEFKLVDRGLCTSSYVRSGTEHYVVTFGGNHPLCDGRFYFQVADTSHKHGSTPLLDPEHDEYGVMYPDARKALAAAKRFCKAVL